MEKCSRSIKKYRLTQEIYLERADDNEFKNYFKIYTEGTPHFEKAPRERNLLISKDNCFYWIKKEEQKIGGVRIKPNYIADLFLIPPNVDLYGTLKFILPLLRYWSNPKEKIEAFSFQEETEAFHKLGFRTCSETRIMIRPTEKFNLNWGIGLRLLQPDESMREEIIKIFFQGFKNGILEETEEAQRKRVDYYFEHIKEHEILIRASTVVKNTETNEIMGVCLVLLWEGLPIIYDLVVVKEFRKHGLGSNMLKRAISILEDEYPAVRLFVTPGNMVEGLYHELGFKTFNTRQHMFMPER